MSSSSWIFGPPDSVIYGEVFSWRIFLVASETHETASDRRLSPIGIHPLHWEDTDLLVARCPRAHLASAIHDAPSEFCTCGLFSFATLSKLMKNFYHYLHKTSFIPVVALVRLEGAIVFHTHGSRAQHQRIIKLFVNKPSSTRQIARFDYLMAHNPGLADKFAWKHEIAKSGHNICGPVDLRPISCDPRELT